MKYTKHLVTITAMLFIAACSNNETQQPTKEDEAHEVVKQVPEQEEVKVEYPVAPTLPEEIVLQPMGLKVQDHQLAGGEMKQLMTEFETEGMSAEQIYNGLVHWFGTDLQGVYSELRDFEPDFGELDLTKEQPTKVKNIAIHLDSSGSMAGQVSGGVKMDLAKSALKKYASGLPEGSILSLRVYGHQGTGNNSDKSLSCSSTEMMYEPNTYNEDSFTSSLEKFKPSGWTPLAASIQNAYEDLKKNASDHTENILFIVSDGIETCDGNPVEEAKKLAESDLNVKVNIIGFNVDDKGQRQLKETAEAGQGEYYTVNSNIDFTNTIDKLLEDARKGYEKNFKKSSLSTKINFRVVEIAAEIRQLGSNFRNVYESEKQLLSEALYELYLQEKISQEDQDAITILIDQRYEGLNQLRESLLEMANGKKDEKHQELLTIISNS